MNKDFNNYYLLNRWNKLNSYQDRYNHFMCSDKTFLNLNDGRQTGKTTFLLDNVKRNDLVLVTDLKWVRELSRMCSTSLWFRTATYHQIKNNFTCFIGHDLSNVKTIWMDEPCYTIDDDFMFQFQNMCLSCKIPKDVRIIVMGK